MLKVGEDNFPNIAEDSMLSEANEFLNYLYEIASKAHKQRVPLQFNGKFIKYT